MAESRDTGDGPLVLQQMMYTEGMATACSSMRQWKKSGKQHLREDIYYGHRYYQLMLLEYCLSFNSMMEEA